ncbi:MAG: hypothetical protein R3A79_08410 [Nannocystaceae bacterium]
MPEEKEESEFTFRLADEKAVAKFYEAGELANPKALNELLQGETKKDTRMKEVLLNFRADLEKVDLSEEQLNGIMRVLIDKPMRGDNWSG